MKTGSLLALVVATAVLYLAREVLLPLALAILFAFLLAPAVRRLERFIWRAPATLLAVAAGFGAIVAVAWFAGNQALSLAAKLPEYRDNIVRKIHSVRAPKGGDLGKAAQALKDIEKQASPERPPLAVKETPGTPHEAFVGFIAPFAKPAASTLAVLVFTVLMLLHRENLRDRVIVLLGPGRIQLMTRAMSEASYRVSRYLMTQLLVNCLFGIPFGIALHFIGVPNALLWGLLGVVLRFIPYAGVWVAAALPAMFAFAIADGWSMVAWTVGTFLALELTLANVVEPWLYGKSAGLSPIAVILAAIFWTWLWGPAGLLLATPLTVCVAVMGRHVPEFGYLNVLLGVEPVLAPDARLYQRLVALDEEEASELLEKHAEAHGLAETLDSVVLPALVLAERDRHKGGLEPARERFIFERMRRFIEGLGEPASEPDPSAPAAYIVPARDEADHAAGLALARLLQQGGLRAPVAAPDVRFAELAGAVEQSKPAAIIISAVPPDAVTSAAYLLRGVRRRFPQLKVIVGLWAPGANVERLKAAGATEVATRLRDVAGMLR